MPRNATRRVLWLSMGLVWLVSAASADPLAVKPFPRDLPSLGVNRVAEASSKPARAPALESLRGLKLPYGLQIDSKSGLRYHASLSLGKATWMVRLKGPFLKRKQLGLGLEVKF